MYETDVRCPTHRRTVQRNDLLADPFISVVVGRPWTTLPLTHAYILFAPAPQLIMRLADMAI